MQRAAELRAALGALEGSGGGAEQHVVEQVGARRERWTGHSSRWTDCEDTKPRNAPSWSVVTTDSLRSWRKAGRSLAGTIWVSPTTGATTDAAPVSR